MRSFRRCEGSGGRLERERLERVRLHAGMRTTGFAREGAGAERLIDDGLDGARATAAFGAAAEAAVNLLWVARKIFRGGDGVANIFVAQHIAGTDNHENEMTFAVTPSHLNIHDCAKRQKEKRCFQVIPK